MHYLCPKSTFLMVTQCKVSVPIHKVLSSNLISFFPFCLHCGRLQMAKISLQFFPSRSGSQFSHPLNITGFMTFFGGSDVGWFINLWLRALQLYSYSLEIWYHHVKIPRLACLVLKTCREEPGLSVFRMKPMTLALYERPLYELASVMILLSYGKVHF